MPFSTTKCTSSVMSLAEESNLLLLTSGDLTVTKNVKNPQFWTARAMATPLSSRGWATGTPSLSASQSKSVSASVRTDSFLSRSSGSVNFRVGSRKLSCRQWVDSFESFNYSNCAETFADAAKYYAKERRADRKKCSFWYAKSLTMAPLGDREAFFSGLTLLVERKPDALEREAILSFLCELVAVEGHGDSKVSQTPFGEQAMQAFVDIGSSLSGIHAVLLRVVERKLASVLCQISPTFFLRLVPLVDLIARHPKHGMPFITRLGAHGEKSRDNGVGKRSEMSYHRPRGHYRDAKRDRNVCPFAQQLAAAHDALMRAESSKYELKERSAARRQTLYRFMSLCAHDTATAVGLWTLIERPSARKPGTSGYLSRIFESRNSVPDVADPMLTRAAELELCASIARNCWLEEKSTARGGSSSGGARSGGSADNLPPGHRRKYVAAIAFRRALPTMVKALDRHASDDKADKPHQVVYQAALVQCIGAVLQRTADNKKAANSGKVPKPKNPFVSMFVRLAKRAESGALMAACLDLLLNVIVKTRGCSAYRDVLETQVQFPAVLQAVAKRLIASMRKKRSSAPSEEHHALALVFDTMYYYNIVSSGSLSGFQTSMEDAERHQTQAYHLTIKLNVAEIKGYDREEIAFKVLEAPQDGSFSVPVRLAAARCLATVPLQQGGQFSAGEIRRVMTILAKMSLSATPETYAVITQILYLTARLADANAPAGAAGAAGGDSKEPVGSTFRGIYAAELVSTVFELLRRCAARDASPADAEFSDPDRRACMCACVKVLMLGWRRPKLCQGITSEASVAIFCRVARQEQALLSFSAPLSLRSYRHIFLEQTPLGARVGTLLRCLESLSERDIVAFRVYHQIANVIQGHNLHTGRVPAFDGSSGAPVRGGISILDELHKAKEAGFHPWSDAQCGTPLQDAKRIEMGALASPTRHATADAPRTPLIVEARALTPQDATRASIVRLVRACARETYRARPAEKIASEETSAEIRTKVLSAIASRGVLCLALPRAGARGRVRGLLIGGPLRRAENARLVGRDDVFDASYAEVYHLFLDPQSARAADAQALLSEFSHRMRAAGFGQCVAWAHDEERVYYATDDPKSVRRGERMVAPALHPREVKARMRAKLDALEREQPRGEGRRRRNRVFCLDNGGGDVVREYLRVWALDKNVWTHNETHAEFLDKKGIEKMVAFLTRRDGVAMAELAMAKVATPSDKKSPDPQSAVRAGLESDAFGTELLLQLRPGGLHEAQQSRRRNGGKSRTAPKSLESQLMRTLIHAESISICENDIVGQPPWGLFLGNGLPEEQRIATLSILPLRTPPPLAGHAPGRVNPHAGICHAFHTRMTPPFRHPKPWMRELATAEATSVSIKADRGGQNPHSDMKTPDKRMAPAKWEEFEAQRRAKYSAYEQEAIAAALEARQSAIDRADARPQMSSLCAALVRTLYTLMTRSSRTSRGRTAVALRKRGVVSGIDRVLRSIGYEIKSSVRSDGVMSDAGGGSMSRHAPRYDCAEKFLTLLRTLLDVGPRGHAKCLDALEFYEAVTVCAKGVLLGLKRLVESRDYDIHGPGCAGGTVIPRRLTARDERLMDTACAVLDETMREVLQMSFFSGRGDSVSRGNRLCRLEAMRLLFRGDGSIIQSLMSLLRYDTEIARLGLPLRLDNRTQEDSYGILAPLDTMRLRAVSAISGLVASSKAFARAFFRQASVGQSRGAVGLRMSLLRAVMRGAGREALRSELQARLRARGRLDPDEIVEFVCFVETQGQCRVLVMANAKRYLTSAPVQHDLPRELSPASVAALGRKGLWGPLEDVQTCLYADVQGVYSALSGQMFAVSRRGVNSAQVFYTPVLGDALRVLEAFERYCRDDLDRPLVDVDKSRRRSNAASLRSGGRLPERDGAVPVGSGGADAKLNPRAGTRGGGGGIGFHGHRSHSFFRDAVTTVLAANKKSIGLQDDPSDVHVDLFTHVGYPTLGLSRALLVWVSDAADAYVLVLVADDRKWDPVGGTGVSTYLTFREALRVSHITNFEWPDVDGMATLRLQYQPAKDMTGYVKGKTFAFACDVAREMWRRRVSCHLRTTAGEGTPSGLGGITTVPAAPPFKATTATLIPARFL